MNDHTIPLEDILHVFGAWTLMVRTADLHGAKPGDRLLLLNSESETIGEALAGRFLPSRNPEIQPIEIVAVVSPDDFKQVKFCQIKS